MCVQLEKVECVKAAAEETVIRLQSNPSYGFRDVISETEYQPEDGGLVCKMKLAFGDAVICVSNSDKKLQRLKRKFARKGRIATDGFVIRVGTEMSRFWTQFANCLRAICHALVRKSDIEEERRRQKIREKHARNAVPGISSRSSRKFCR